MDPDKRTCRYKDQEIRLADTEFRLLFILVKRPGTIFTHEDLLRRVWGPEFIGELNYLRVSLSRIKKETERRQVSRLGLPLIRDRLLHRRPFGRGLVMFL